MDWNWDTDESNDESNIDNYEEKHVLLPEEEREIEESFFGGTIFHNPNGERKRKSTDIQTIIPNKKYIVAEQDEADTIFDKSHEETANSYMTLSPKMFNLFCNDNMPTGSSVLKKHNELKHDPYAHLKGRARAIALADARIAARESVTAPPGVRGLTTKSTTETLTYNLASKPHHEKRRKKHARADKDEVANRIFGLFERRRFYSFTELQKLIRQPIPYLKEILMEICVLHKEHPNKNKYSLKPEYCFYSDTHKLADNNRHDTDDEFVDVP